MTNASPDDVFTDAIDWNVAAAADYLGERGLQIIDWAWKQGIISLYGRHVGKSEVLEVKAADAERAATILKQSMIDGLAETFPGAPLNGLVDLHIAGNWADAKG